MAALFESLIEEMQAGSNLDQMRGTSLGVEEFCWLECSAGGLEDDELALWLMSRVSGGFTPSVSVVSWTNDTMYSTLAYCHAG